MKNLLKNIIKTAFVVSMMFFGAVFADAAGQFINYDPMGGTVTSISSTTYSGHKESINVSIPNPGDSAVFRVYVAYQNVRDNYNIWNARGRFIFPTTGTSSSVDINGSLTGRDGESMQDSATLNGLPSSWRIDLTEAWKNNNHTASNSPDCVNSPGAGPDAYAYDVQVSTSEAVSSNGVFLNDLDYYGNPVGICDQAYFIGYFRVTNTENNSVSVDVRTEGENYINGETQATLNGRLESGNDVDVWFVMGENNQNLNCATSTRYSAGYSYDGPRSFSTNVSGLNSGSTYYYKSCGRDANGNTDEGSTNNFSVTGGYSNGLDVQTDNASNIGNGSVSLNGHLVSGSNATVWFVMKEGTDYLLDCFNSEQKVNNIDAASNLSTGNAFTQYVSGLSGSRYYYKACANNGAMTDSVSSVLSFELNSNNGTLPYADTRDANNVDDNSADITGAVDMNSYINGFVFFVYGKDESVINNIESDNNEYSDISEDGENLRKVSVDSNLDSHDFYEETVNNLDADSTYYYNICVEYVRANDQVDLECGSVHNFRTNSNGNSSDVETRNVDNITSTSAELCGDLNDDGGNSNLRTWMEYRKTSSNTFERTTKVDRGEGYFCETVRGLSSNTNYYYRACSDNGCDSQFRFKTSNGVSNGDDPYVTTNVAYSITSNSAVLPGTYVTHANKGTVWFQYGYTPNYLNKSTRHYTKYGTGGTYVHSFTNLKSNQRYCYRAMIETVNGSDHGSVNCFYTTEGSTVNVVVPDDDNDVDLSDLGLGLSLVRLEINDHKEKVTKDEYVTYEISWENISELDLENLELNIEIPREVQITSASRGQLDEDRNAIMYTVSNLDAGEKNSMTITGIVTDGKLGDALTADATLAFNNPVNEAREDATDYDVDEFTVLTALGTASVFGLANITFLGWLTILLGLLIVFLVARWLYLEREELRAQAFANGYGRAPYAMAPVDNRNDYIDAPRQVPTRNAHYNEPVNAPVAQQHNVAPQSRPVQNPQAGERTDYRPYRPNRG